MTSIQLIEVGPYIQMNEETEQKAGVALDSVTRECFVVKGRQREKERGGGGGRRD